MKEQIIQLHNEGFSYREIADKIGCSKSTISYHIGKRTNKPKGKGEALVCKCKGKKSHSAMMCKECWKTIRFEKQEKRTLEDISLIGNARVKWSTLRELARRKLERLGVKKECKICQFDIVVDCCHIKPISKFKSNSLVGEVNSKENLVYLCPNHHKMFDKGLIEL